MTRLKTKKKKELFVQKFPEYKWNITKTCQHVEIARKTYYEWVENDAKFRESLEESKEELKDHLESLALKLASKGNTGVLIFMLKTLCKDRGYAEYENQSKSLGVITVEQLQQAYDQHQHEA